jgi:hypothetical protein
MRIRDRNKYIEFEVPVDIFSLTDIEKNIAFNYTKNLLVDLVNKQLPMNKDRLGVLKEIIETSISISEQNEEYEVCYVLNEIKKLLNAQPD